jgi:hypothetical protein
MHSGGLSDTCPPQGLRACVPIIRVRDILRFKIILRPERGVLNGNSCSRIYRGHLYLEYTQWRRAGFRCGTTCRAATNQEPPRSSVCLHSVCTKAANYHSQHPNLLSAGVVPSCPNPKLTALSTFMQLRSLHSRRTWDMDSPNTTRPRYTHCTSRNL